MLVAWHDNAYDNRGQNVGGSGSYFFWIRKDQVEIYAERPEDLSSFYHSIQ